MRVNNRLGEFLEDDRKRYSIVRLGYIVSVLTSCFIGVWCTLKTSPDDAIGLVAAIMAIASAGKVAQKKIENSTETPI